MMERSRYRGEKGMMERINETFGGFSCQQKFMWYFLCKEAFLTLKILWLSVMG